MRLRVRATSRSFNILCTATIKPDSGTPRSSPVWSHLEPVCESVTRTGGTGHRCRAILAYTSSAGNQGIEVAFTGAHLGSCQPGNDAEALRRTTRDYTLPTRCRTNPEPRQRVGTSWRLCHTLSVQSGAAVWQRLLSNFKYSCLQPTATNARPLFTPDLLRRVQFLACTACRVAIRLDTLARGGSRARASCTVPRLRVRPLVSNNEQLSFHHTCEPGSPKRSRGLNTTGNNNQNRKSP